MRKIALKVKRKTKNSHRWLDMAETAKRKTEDKYISESRNLLGWYNSFEKHISEACEDCDRKVFGKEMSCGKTGYQFSSDKLLSILN